MSDVSQLFSFAFFATLRLYVQKNFSLRRKVAKKTQSIMLVACLCLGAVVSSAQTVADRIVVTVNTEAITYSDLLWQLALQPQTPLVRPRSEDLNQVLERVIDQRLVAQEAEKLPSIRPTDEETDAALAELIKRFPTPAEFQTRVESVGLQPDALRDIVRARVAIDKFLDFRFRAFTIISTAEVADYYRDVYLPRFRQTQPGSVVPTLDAARERIEKILTEEKIAADTDAFLQTARTAAEVVRLAQL